MTNEEPPPPSSFAPFEVERTGRRLGFDTLEIRAGGHVLRVFAGSSHDHHRVYAELDGRRLTRSRVRRTYRVCSRDEIVRRWILSKASEFDGPRPCYSTGEIAANLKRSGRGIMSGESVRRLIWRLAPLLAERRRDYWRALRYKPARGTGKRKR